MNNRPKEWEEDFLGNIFTFEKKSGVKAGEGTKVGKYKFFTSSDIQSKYIDAFNFNGEYLIFGTGGQASLHYCKEKFSTSTDCFVVSIADKVQAKYVYYYLKSKMHLLENGFKGAGLKHISKDYLKKIKIEFPKSKEVQKKIVAIIEKAEKLIESRKEADILTDKYLLSGYYKAFLKNPSKKSWKKASLKELALKKPHSMRTGPFGSALKHSEFVDGGVAVLGIDNVVKNSFCWDKRRYITKAKYSKLNQYRVFPNDVLISIMATVGRSAVVPEDIPLAINTKHLAAISLDTKIANPHFISYSIRHNPELLAQIKDKNRGAIMPGLNLTIIQGLTMPLPPVVLQDKFGNQVKEIDELKGVQLSAKSCTVALYNSLLQKAFKGEIYA